METLNMNRVSYTKWKGKPLIHITAGLKLNKNIGGSNPFRPQPLKIYRKEIASTILDHPNVSQTCMSIDDINMPGGYTTTTSNTNINGLTMTLDSKEANFTNNSTYHGTCAALSTQGVCLTVENNAKRRVRSAGMSRPKFSNNTQGNLYSSDTKQYLMSRNKTFAQNQYNYFKHGNGKDKPGTTTTLTNIYSPAGNSQCLKYYIKQDTSFQYEWPSGMNNGNVLTTVNVPKGYYTAADINNLLQITMSQNKHYYINIASGSFVYLLDIAYNIVTGKLELRTFLTNTTIFPPTMFKPENEGTNKIFASNINTLCPYFVIPQTLSEAFGINSGSYPPTGADYGGKVNNSTIFQSIAFNNSVNTLKVFVFTSSFTPGISGDPYRKIYYKPNNPQFAQQGAVSASSLITRVKYNSITSNTLKYQSALGSSVASAMSYSGDISMPYTLKSKIGFHETKTPVFNKTGFISVQSSCVRVRR